jgi:glycosyl transferase family 2
VTVVLPRITFGVIVLNGEPFTRYCLRSLYPFAHQIIVVEGGSRHAREQSTPDGHSVDDTLEILQRFKAEEDPEDKVEIVTRSGFWKEKDEQSRAYAERATGDYLWQVDIDEFYHPETMRRVLTMLSEDPDITAVSFPTITFWGSLDYEVNGLILRAGGHQFHRLFRFGPGYEYKSHRPPTILDPQGRDLRKLKWLSGGTLARRGIYVHHYALLFPGQVLRKVAYYQSFSKRARKAKEWAQRCYLKLGRPYGVHNVCRHLSWLEKFRGEHPPEVVRMFEDIVAEHLEVEVRPTADVEKLLSKGSYAVGTSFLKAVAPIYGTVFHRWGRRPAWMSKRALSRLLGRKTSQ